MSYLYWLCAEKTKVCFECSVRLPIYLFQTKSGLCEMCDSVQQLKILNRSLPQV